LSFLAFLFLKESPYQEAAYNDHYLLTMKVTYDITLGDFLDNLEVSLLEENAVGAQFESTLIELISPAHIYYGNPAVRKKDRPKGKMLEAAKALGYL